MTTHTIPQDGAGTAGSHRERTRRRKAVGAVLALSLLGGGVAFAYWTAGGSGTGSASTGTTTPLTAVQTSTVTAMGPGVAAQGLSGNFNNPNPGPTYVSTVTASIASVTPASGATGSCDATDYELANPVMTVNAEVAAGTGKGSWTGATIAFKNKASVNQDGCKGATVNLAYAIS